MRPIFYSVFIVVAALQSICLAQQLRITKDRTYATVEEFLSDEEGVHKEKLKLLKLIDPRGRFTEEQHQKLWDKNVQLNLMVDTQTVRPKADASKTDESKTDETLKIDAFGIGLSTSIHEKYPNLAAQLMKKYTGEVAGREITYGEIYDVIYSLKSELLDPTWARAGDKEYSALILRATVLKHHSQINKRNECWLLVDALHAKTSPYDLFVSDFIDEKIRLPGERVRTEERESGEYYPPSHPMSLENQFFERTYRLKRNRTEPRVAVSDDGLTIPGRESTYGFKLINKTKQKAFQIEGCHWRGEVEPSVKPALGEVFTLIDDRVPNGTFLTLEELHLRTGSVANALQKKFPEYNLVVKIEEKRIENQVFASLCVELVHAD